MKQSDHIFDRPSHAGCVSERLFSLRQGTRSVAEYAVESGTPMVESGRNDFIVRSLS